MWISPFLKSQCTNQKNDLCSSVLWNCITDWLVTTLQDNTMISKLKVPLSQWCSAASWNNKDNQVHCSKCLTACMSRSNCKCFMHCTVLIAISPTYHWHLHYRTVFFMCRRLVLLWPAKLPFTLAATASPHDITPLAGDSQWYVEWQ